VGAGGSAAESSFLFHKLMLLAKSGRAGKRISLFEHSAAVAAAGQALFGNPKTGLTRLGTRFIRFFGLGASDANRFGGARISRWSGGAR
jgi:hypothetical protein